MTVEFLDINERLPLRYSVVVAKYGDKWVFCRHKDRTTYEIPGGHIEEGETPYDAARRELYEETGITDAEIFPVCIYRVNDSGMLFYAKASKLGQLPDSEMAEVILADNLPTELTYPMIQPYLFERVKIFLKENQCRQ